jgi:hypothetical protein
MMVLNEIPTKGDIAYAAIVIKLVKSGYPKNEAEKIAALLCDAEIKSTASQA